MGLLRVPRRRLDLAARLRHRPLRITRHQRTLLARPLQALARALRPLLHRTLLGLQRRLVLTLLGALRQVVFLAAELQCFLNGAIELRRER